MPSLLVAWKRSTRPSAIVFRKSSFARVRRRSRFSRHRRDLGRLLDRALEHDERAAGRHVEGLHVALAGDDALDLPALDAHAGEVPVAPVLEEEEHGPAVGREAGARRRCGRARR